MKVLFDSKSSLKVVNFDGDEPQTPAALFDVLELASRCQDKVRLSFPFRDMAALLDARTITQEVHNMQLRRFQKALKLRPAKGHAQLYPVPLDSPFLAPFGVFVEEAAPVFPKFLSADEVRDLQAMPEKPFVRTKSEFEFTSNKVYAGTMGRPPRKPLLAKDIFDTPPPKSIVVSPQSQTSQRGTTSTVASQNPQPEHLPTLHTPVLLRQRPGSAEPEANSAFTRAAMHPEQGSSATSPSAWSGPCAAAESESENVVPAKYSKPETSATATARSEDTSASEHPEYDNEAAKFYVRAY